MASKKPTQKEENALLRRENERLRTENVGLATRVPEPAPVESLTHAPPTSIAGVNETATALAAAQAKANVEARFLVAINRPRNLDAVRVELLKDCRRPNFAEVATYERPVGGGKKASGPSIRFAEAAARAFGNLNIDARTIYESDEKRIISSNVTNLESNVTYGIEITINKTVERRKLKEGQSPLSVRTNSTGQTVYRVEATEDDMLAKTNSLTSKALRNSIIRHLPGDLVEDAQRQCYATLRDRNSKDPDAARKRIVDGFASLNVPIKELNDLLNHDIASASPKEMDYLRGVFTVLKEGDANWSELLAVAREDRGDKPGSSGSRSADIKSAIAQKARGATGNGAAPAAQQPAAANPAESNEKPQQAPAAAAPAPAPAHIPEDGEVSIENEPTDAELGQPIADAEQQAAAAAQSAEPEPEQPKAAAEPAESPEPDPTTGLRKCPEESCEGILVDDLNEPDYMKCPNCQRWVKR